MRVVCLLALVACHSTRAERRDCDRILERIVALELKERGFSDPALVELKQTALKRTLDLELAACVGRRLPAEAMYCVERAKSVEELTHACLSD